MTYSWSGTAEWLSGNTGWGFDGIGDGNSSTVDGGPFALSVTIDSQVGWFTIPGQPVLAFPVADVALTLNGVQMTTLHDFGAGNAGTLWLQDTATTDDIVYFTNVPSQPNFRHLNHNDVFASRLKLPPSTFDIFTQELVNDTSLPTILTQAVFADHTTMTNGAGNFSVLTPTGSTLFVAVPEPSALTFLAILVAGCACRRKHRSRWHHALTREFPCASAAKRG